MLARALPSILPRMTIDEALEAARAFSVANALPSNAPHIQHWPICALPYTISQADLIWVADHKEVGS
jgi:magnesium chelatase family protein